MNNTLVKVKFGSRLYGTYDENSDFDYKLVYLPDLDDLLLNKKLANKKEKSDGLGHNEKMVVGGSEVERIPFQVFLDDFFNGQTYALEIAFAVLQDHYVFDPIPVEDFSSAENHHAYNIPFYKSIITELVGKFLSNDLKKMVGYAVSQAKVYGLKTERFHSVKSAVIEIQSYEYRYAEELFASNGKHTLGDCPILLEKLSKLPHVSLCKIQASRISELDIEALDVCGLKFPLTFKLDTILSSLKNTLDTYGERVKKFEDEGVDWKAISHAIRITEQVLELASTGKLKFPRPNADVLRDVKLGKITLYKATQYLETAFSKVDNAVTNSVLQEKTAKLESEFLEWKLQVLRSLYGLSKD